MTEDRTKSEWLKWAEFELAQRDPVDAFNDAEALVASAKKRLEKAFATNGVDLNDL